MSIFMQMKDYSAMRWPAPSGYHVPLNTEWQAVYDVWTALGGWSSDWTNFWIALKLPFAGYRSYSSAGVSNQGSIGRYWYSSRYNTDGAYNLSLNSAGLNPQNANYRASGYSVRCFKNSPVVPMSSWTKLYWTSIEAGWIFWSSADWLISLSSDWTTWITIADKNLWATTVWNSWDTLSEANCWKYYQRWNNYWFPRTWTIANQSKTQVDASSYWPWNYYSSDTFIKYNWRWDSTDNWNLRWWVTWVVRTPTWPKKIYIWIAKDVQTSFYYDFTQHTESEIRDFWNLTWGTLQLDSTKWIYAAYWHGITFSASDVLMYPTHTMTVTIKWTTRWNAWSNSWMVLNGGFWYHDNWHDSWGWILEAWGWQSYSSSTNIAYTSTFSMNFDTWSWSRSTRWNTALTATFDWPTWLETVRSARLEFNPWTIRVKTIKITTT